MYTAILDQYNASLVSVSGVSSPSINRAYLVLFLSERPSSHGEFLHIEPVRPFVRASGSIMSDEKY